MRIAHGHRNGGMPENALQAENVTAGHHVMAGKRVAQDVGELTRGTDPGTLISSTKGRTAGHTQPTITRHPQL